MNAFDWLVQDAVGGCIYPDREESLAVLAGRLGVSVLVNLHERPHAGDTLARHGIEQVHLPVRDFTPPTPEQLDAGVAAIAAAVAAGRRVAVHCAAGLGRTGTLLACYLVHEGAELAAAIARVRAVRPGSIETPEQEAAVYDFAARRGAAQS